MKKLVVAILFVFIVSPTWAGADAVQVLKNAYAKATTLPALKSKQALYSKVKVQITGTEKKYSESYTVNMWKSKKKSIIKNKVASLYMDDNYKFSVVHIRKHVYWMNTAEKKGKETSDMAKGLDKFIKGGKITKDKKEQGGRRIELTLNDTLSSTYNIEKVSYLVSKDGQLRETVLYFTISAQKENRMKSIKYTQLEFKVGNQPTEMNASFKSLFIKKGKIAPAYQKQGFELFDHRRKKVKKEIKKSLKK